MLRAGLVGMVMLGVAGVQAAQAQTAMREDTFDIQTALHFYGFMDGPVDGEVGPDTVRGLSRLGTYLRLGGLSVDVLDADPRPLPLRALMDAYAAKDDVEAFDLDERDLARLRREGERFWVRKQLQADPATWGVDISVESDTCGAWANEALIGEVINPDELPELEGAGSVRVLYFGPMTTDFRPDRLNALVDPWNMVTNLNCG
ncbi:hypothetical protein [Tropicimonas sp. S265A]|uniref:hypothetical protein n=1 Tax=Tropicimonas sp. S265A TaxID=3415134 RepID=UPI003C7B13C0